MSRPARRRGALLFAALAFALSGAGCRTATPEAGDWTRVEGVVLPSRDAEAYLDAVIRRDIEAVNAAMVATFNRGDYLGAARYYTDDARIIGPGTRVTGRAGVDRYWTSLPAGATWKLEVLEVGGSHHSPWQLGRSTLVMPSRDGGGATNTSIVDFLAIWRRQPDRSLKLYIDMYVSAPRPTPPR